MNQTHLLLNGSLRSFKVCEIFLLRRFKWKTIRNSQPLNEFGTVTKKRIAGTGTQDALNDHEAFLYRLLMCVPGVSSTKAMSVLQHYKSVGELMKAYNQQPSQEMKEDMLSV